MLLAVASWSRRLTLAELGRPTDMLTALQEKSGKYVRLGEKTDEIGNVLLAIRI